MRKDYLKVLKKCESKLTKNEAEFLLSITRKIPKHRVIVEIGSYKGGSAFLLAKGSMKNKKGKVYTIEPNISNSKILRENIKNAGLHNWIIPITKTSNEAAKNWKKSISFLFIDGNHGYNFVKMDFLLWEKYLVEGGIIAFHDSRDSKNNILFRKVKHSYIEGPRKVVKENILNSKRFRNIGFVDTITYAKKVKDRGIGELLNNIVSPYKRKLIIFLKRLDKKIGGFGIFLKKYFPKLYFLLKKLKDFKFKR